MLAAAVIGLWAVVPVHLSPAQQARPVVYLVPIEGVIDLGLAPFVERNLDEAAVSGAAAMILEIDTFGGRVDAAVLIRDALLRSTVKTVAFINKRAISAGALISLAAEHIVMAEGGYDWGGDTRPDRYAGGPSPAGRGKDRFLYAKGIPRDRGNP